MSPAATSVATDTLVGVGWSSESEGFAAGRQVAQQARRGVGSSRIDLTILFASARYEQSHLLQGVRDVLGNVPLIGGSDAGEIVPGATLQRSAVLMLVSSESIRFAISAAEHLGDGPYAAGQSAASQCVEASRQESLPAPPREASRQAGRRAFLMMADGLTGASQELIRGAQAVLGASFPIVGALMGDDLLFRQTYQYHNGRVLTNSAVGLLISGSVRVGVSARHGWRAVGRPHRVTRAAGNVLHELDGQPAARVYEEYLGPEEVRRMRGWLLSQATVSYPLGMSVEGEEEFLLRNVVQITDDGALLCAGDVWEGAWIRLMVGTREGALEAARIAASQAREGLSQVAFGIVFDSVARRKLFGRQAAEELDVVQAALGAQVPFIGCYTYGEQAPLRSMIHVGRSYFHNETALVVAVGT